MMHQCMPCSSLDIRHLTVQLKLWQISNTAARPHLLIGQILNTAILEYGNSYLLIFMFNCCLFMRILANAYHISNKAIYGMCDLGLSYFSMFLIGKKIRHIKKIYFCEHKCQRSRSRPYLVKGSDLLWKDLRPDKSCKKNNPTQVVFGHCFCTFEME